VRDSHFASRGVLRIPQHYAGVREELEDEPKVPAADAIREARSQLKEPALLARFRIAKDASVWWALGCPTGRCAKAVAATLRDCSAEG
jgi:hypothetical protein